MKTENNLLRKDVQLLFALLVLLSSCSPKYYYNKGLEIAQNPTPASVYSHLDAITPNNKKLTRKTINGKEYILTVNWTKDTTYYTKKFDSSLGYYTYNTQTHPIWITLSPEMKQEKLGKLSDKKMNMRIRQLLGLPPNAAYAYFVEIWVTPEDLFRPCFNPGITTDVCEFAPSAADAANQDYMCWLYQYIYNSYSDPDIMNRYPFTHLGYTYDWNRKTKNHVGFSEFVIGNNKNVYINRIYTTRQYFN